MNNFDIQLDISKNGTSHIVTVKRGGELLLVDTVRLTREADRQKLLDRLLKLEPKLSRDEVSQTLLQAAAQVAQQHAKDKEPPPPPDPLEATPAEVRAEAEQLLHSPDLMRQVVRDFSAVGIAGERELAATLYLIGTSRLLDRPLAAIVQGPSSSGKSYVLERVSSLFPPEAVLIATDLTPQSLYYLKPGSLKHRWVIAGERRRIEEDETAEATRALREMLSAGRLSKLLPVKEDGRMQTVLIEQEGPIAYCETTTLSHIFDEDANRCLLLNTDEREEQTRRVLEAAAVTAQGQAADPSAVIARHHAMQRLLQPAAVIVPFAGVLANLIDSRRVEVRRAFPHLLAAIRASALLHQYQRQRDGQGRVVAARDDYELARYLLLAPLGRLIGGEVSAGAARLAERLQSWFGTEQTWTRKHVVQRDTYSRAAVQGWLSELSEAGIIETVEPAVGRKPATYRLASGDRRSAAVLPPPESVFAGLA